HDIEPMEYVQAFLMWGLDAMDEEQAYTRSLEVEPRDADEAADRLLMTCEQQRKEIEALQLRVAELEGELGALRDENSRLNAALRNGDPPPDAAAADEPADASLECARSPGSAPPPTRPDRPPPATPPARRLAQST